jgi:hypothetical protein
MDLMTGGQGGDVELTAKSEWFEDFSRLLASSPPLIQRTKGL